MKVIFRLYIYIFYILFGVCLCFSQDHSSAVTKLRHQLKYEFALDFAMKIETDQAEEQWFNICKCDTFPTFHRGSTIQGFQLGLNMYSLYHIQALDEHQSYYLLETRPATRCLYLFDTDSKNNTYLDKHDDFNTASGGWSTLDTLNGQQVIKINFSTTGSGFSGKHFEIVGVVNKTFKELFHCDLSDWNDTTRRSLSTVKYVDLNDDGFLDIQLESSEDILDPNEHVNVFKDGELANAKVTKNLLKTVEKYIWNPKTFGFTKLN